MDKIEAVDPEEASSMTVTQRSARPVEGGSRYSGNTVFVGELLKDMTVDYERSASEDRLDEVNAGRYRRGQKTPNPSCLHCRLLLRG